MKRIRIACIALSLLAFVGCSNADQVVPAEQVAAAEAEVVSGDWIAQVFVETADGIGFVHSHPVPNTTTYWMQEEADGEYLPNVGAIVIDLGPAQEWAPELKKEDVISMGIVMKDLSVVLKKESYDFFDDPLFSMVMVEMVCNVPYPNVNGVYTGVFTCTMNDSPIWPRYCMFNYGAFKYNILACSFFGF